MNIHKNKLMLLSILFLCLFVRVFNLGAESLWFDEGGSIITASLSVSEIVRNVLHDNSPPLYYLILHYWIKLFGISEFAVRFPSLIFGVLVVFMVYKVGSEIVNEYIGILSSLLVGFSVFHVYYSQEARNYSLLALMALLSFYFFLKLQKEKLIFSVGYIVSSILLIYTHIFGFFIIIAQNIYALANFLFSKKPNKLNFKKWIILQVILVLAFVPWAGIFIDLVMGVARRFWITEPSITYFGGTFYKYSGSILLFGLFIILLLLSIFHFDKNSGRIHWKDLFKPIMRNKRNEHPTDSDTGYLLFVWLLTPILIPYIISKLFVPIYIIKYTIGASLSFFLLIAKGIGQIKHKRNQVVVIFIVVLLSVGNLVKYYTEVDKEQWREVANYMDNNAQKGDLLLFSERVCLENVFEY